MDKNKYDFSGWATKANMRCSDGRVIMQNAFQVNDGGRVPLVWNHRHDDPSFVIGHADLKNVDGGVYAYCALNSTKLGETTKKIVEHGDVASLSIWANQLVENGSNVVHGKIREVSVVLAGANPGASIENVIRHGEDIIEIPYDEGIIYNDEDIKLYHSDDSQFEGEQANESEEEELSLSHADESNSNSDGESEETVKDVIDSMNEKQKKVMFALIGSAMDEDATDDEETTDSEGGNTVKHNVFDSETENKDHEGAVLSHSDMKTMITDIKRYGNLRDSIIVHAADYGIENIDYLFPDFRNLTRQPEFIKRRTEWVNSVMTGVSRSPFSRVKTQFADITEDAARAKGYMKGKYKKEEVFTLLKRTTDPQTVYKKQKLDRDDISDITDFDVVVWVKGEMRLMLDEEIARAILIGDGRLASDDDKIKTDHIRPIWTDEELFTINSTIDADSVTDPDERAKQFIRTAIKARKDYQGSGNPVLFTTEDFLTDMLLLEDKMGRPLYDSVSQLATKLRVSRIETVPVMENQKREVSGKHRLLMGLIVNLTDYNVGADRGGAVSMFDDFNLDYNQQQYLIETRCSGALTKPFSAIAIEMESTSDFQ